MTLYSCKCGNTQEIGKQTIRYRDNGWRTIEARCKCGLWMIVNLKKVCLQLNVQNHH